MSASGLFFSTGPARTTLPALCGTDWNWLLSAANRSDTLALIFVLNPPGALLGSWSFMLLAMMPPLLAAPLRHVWRSSLPERRAAALFGFALGYGGFWLAVGPAFIGLGLLLQVLGGGFAFAGALALALLWSATPWHRRALKRVHAIPSTGRSGSVTFRDRVVFGTLHGARCCRSNWAWMLATQAAGAWHLLAMILSGAAMLAERASKPPQPLIYVLLAGFRLAKRA